MGRFLKFEAAVWLTEQGWRSLSAPRPRTRHPPSELRPGDSEPQPGALGQQHNRKHRLLNRFHSVAEQFNLRRRLQLVSEASAQRQPLPPPPPEVSVASERQLPPLQRLRQGALAVSAPLPTRLSLLQPSEVPPVVLAPLVL